MIITKVLDENNEWVEGIPQDGQAFRRYFNGKLLEETHAAYVKPKTQEEREWRDQELERTDKFMMLNDYPAQRDQAMRTYRQALRDWPDTPDFPDTRPVLGG